MSLALKVYVYYWFFKNNQEIELYSQTQKADDGINLPFKLF